LKLFPANFFYWFQDKFHYFPEPYQHWNQLKQFVRFTDSGHIVSFIYFFWPAMLPIAFNVHFIITVAYWYGRLVLNMKDADAIIHSELVEWFNRIWTNMNHSVHITLLVREIWMMDSSVCYDYFGWHDIYYTFVWVYGWFFCVYLPWRYVTGDVVYEFFDFNFFTIYQQIQYIGFIHLLVLLGNLVGYSIMSIFMFMIK
jgi:hypothetical protein